MIELGMLTLVGAIFAARTLKLIVAGLAGIAGALFSAGGVEGTS